MPNGAYCMVNLALTLCLHSRGLFVTTRTSTDILIAHTGVRIHDCSISSHGGGSQIGFVSLALHGIFQVLNHIINRVCAIRLQIGDGL